MRVALDVGPLKPEPAGVGIYVRSLASALAGRLPAEDLVLIGRRPDASGLPDRRSLSRSPGAPYSLWALTSASRAARRAGTDVTHFTDGLVPLVRTGRTVLTVHDLSIVERWRDHRLVRLARVPFVLIAPRLADSVICDSQATADAVMRLTGTSARRIHVVPLAARPGFVPASNEAVAAVTARFGLERDRYILVPGTKEPRKNGARVIEAFSQLVASKAIDDDIVLAFAGGAGWRNARFDEALQASAAKRQIRSLGYVTDGDLGALMTGALAVSFVSLYEGFGLPVLEALACGAIIVTSDRSSLPEVAGDAAFLTDPTSTSSIADGLRLAIGLDAASRSARSSDGIAHAATFSWARTADETLAVYEQST